jgi:dCMP deaminase
LHPVIFTDLSKGLNRESMQDRNPHIVFSEKTSVSRPSWETYFMDIARLVASRSTCRRRSVGAVIVKDKRILSTGYNGAPSGLSHCLDIGCLREKLMVASGQRHELCRGIHAEQNAIIQAAYHGFSIKTSVLYCTNLPCAICTKMIINAGICRIYYQEGYADELSLTMLGEAGIEVIQTL